MLVFCLEVLGLFNILYTEKESIFTYFMLNFPVNVINGGWQFMVASQKYAITGWLMALQPLFDIYKYSVFVELFLWKNGLVELLLLFSISILEVLLGASFL